MKDIILKLSNAEAKEVGVAIIQLLFSKELKIDSKERLRINSVFFNDNRLERILDKITKARDIL